jgi:hypothetical protein
VEVSIEGEVRRPELHERGCCLARQCVMGQALPETRRRCRSADPSKSAAVRRCSTRRSTIFEKVGCSSAFLTVQKMNRYAPAHSRLLKEAR